MYCIKCDQNGKEPFFKSPTNNLKKKSFFYILYHQIMLCFIKLNCPIDQFKLLDCILLAPIVQYDYFI